MKSRGRHARRRRGGRRLTLLLAVVGGALVLAAGSALAASRYDRATADRILPGVSVFGVDVGEMTREQAIRAVQGAVDRALATELVVRAGGEEWRVPYAELGVSGDVAGAVEEAFRVSESHSLLSRVFHRVLDRPVDRSVDIRHSYDQAVIDAFVERVAATVARPARDAMFALVDGELEKRRSAPGQALRVRASRTRIGRALQEGRLEVTLPVRAVEPERTEEDLGRTIVVRLAENRLYLYDGLRIVRDYPVATGSPGFPTPQGEFLVINKRENPDWTNPDPDGWGADLPAYIPPGPGNPLGTRALYLDAPGIRIHGTWDLASIGTYASHGCVRMTIDDSEELYETVDVGTPVLILW